MFGIVGPKNMADDIVEELNREINAGTSPIPNIKARLVQLGGTVLAGSAADIGKLFADEAEKWGKVIWAANLKAE